MLQHLNSRPARPDRVMVVGAAGFVGGAIAARLEGDGTPVLRLSRREIDLLSPGAAAALAARLRPGDVLVSAAALAPCKTPAMLRDNAALAVALVEAASAVELAQLVNISSDAVYADSAQPLTEDSPAAPETLHGVMHLMREGLFRAEAKAPLVTLRPSLLYGAGDPHNGYGPNRFRRLAVQGEPITLFGEGEERRDHVLIDDLAELAARVIAHRSTGSLNIATGVVTSFRAVAEMTLRLAGKSVPIRTMPRSGPMPHNGYRAFDIAACRAAFPDFRYTALEPGLARALAEMRARS